MSPLPEKHQRRHPRFDVDSVHGQITSLLEARLLEWGPNGFSFESASWLAPDQRFVLRLRSRSSSTPLAGRIAWSSLTRTRRDEAGNVQPVYRSGIELEPQSPHQARQMLAAFERLAGTGGTGWEERRPGRFTAPEPVPIVLELESEMTVRRMSRSGMLVETGLAPHLESHIRLDVELAGHRLRSRGRVAFREPGAGERRRLSMRLGVEFLDLPTPDETALGAFLQTVAHRELPAVTV